MPNVCLVATTPARSWSVFGDQVKTDPYPDPHPSLDLALTATLIRTLFCSGDGRPVVDLKVAADQLLLEYLVAGLQDEAARCIKELSAPYFHHEIVKRAISCALDRSEELQVKMSALLVYLVREDVISQQQVVKGFRRVYGILSDLRLDTPNAATIVNEFTSRAITDGVLPQSCAALMVET